jgi:hypothetical protein
MAAINHCFIFLILIPHQSSFPFPNRCKIQYCITFCSVKYSDVDENGIVHMMLCRVIMGNVEIVHPGSKQHRPSSDYFDSGVDDLKNPQHYIVWDMNLNRHIYSEFVVTIKMPSITKGN